MCCDMLCQVNIGSFQRVDDSVCTVSIDIFVCVWTEVQFSKFYLCYTVLWLWRWVNNSFLPILSFFQNQKKFSSWHYKWLQWQTVCNTYSVLTKALLFSNGSQNFNTISKAITGSSEYMLSLTEKIISHFFLKFWNLKF